MENCPSLISQSPPSSVYLSPQDDYSQTATLHTMCYAVYQAEAPHFNGQNVCCHRDVVTNCTSGRPCTSCATRIENRVAGENLSYQNQYRHQNQEQHDARHGEGDGSNQPAHASDHGLEPPLHRNHTPAPEIRYYHLPQYGVSSSNRAFSHEHRCGHSANHSHSRSTRFHQSLPHREHCSRHSPLPPNNEDAPRKDHQVRSYPIHQRKEKSISGWVLGPPLPALFVEHRCNAKCNQG